MSANSSPPSPTSGFRLHDEEDENDLTANLDLGFDGAEDLLRVWRQGMRPDPNLTVSEWAEAVWKRCPVVSFHKAVGGRDGTFHRWHRPGTGHAFP